jgi:flavin reductase (DIM6/NTAB) family NADH-FMN oxidoreductase RutF
MTDELRESDGATVIDPSAIGNRERYQLLTSLLVPRPIGWLSTRADGVANLAPFSYYAALASTPMLVGVSIGSRRGQAKDTLHNIRKTGAFCVNVVSDSFLEPMNASAGEHPPQVDEFAVAGLPAAEASTVDAPYVAGCPAVFECRLFREVELGAAPNVLVIGEVLAVRLSRELELESGSYLVDPRKLQPVSRLGADLYARMGDVVALPRPRIE